MFDNRNAVPLINPNPQLQSYYCSLESRAGYRLLLGGTRHFGYWDSNTYWPFPLSSGLRRMEEKLAEALSLPTGSRILDAGCGVGHVALYLAKSRGLLVEAIDVVDHHVVKAIQNVKQSGLPEGTVRVSKMDYHHLEIFDDQSFDGIYTMETLVHATDAKAVLAGFYRLLRPGGRLVQFEYDHEVLGKKSPWGMAQHLKIINNYAALPMFTISEPGILKSMLEESGFQDVVVRDYSANIRPMTRFFFLLAIIPYIFIRLFRLERYLINTIAGVGLYLGYGHWHYLAISATKLESSIEASEIQVRPRYYNNITISYY
ncbi:S-adenosyl-L-methionine-dependent methyltransferase [Nemania sp. FL0031]|nr:S-adenosyl-L-methionine-dependent methyltransferase [Nemania sp. FL0031]